ncbi:MAG: hypothetical protein JWR10_918 [Rubritepida sp.]|nr:hypothetical protein [Rubritepida sp.]
MPTAFYDYGSWSPVDPYDYYSVPRAIYDGLCRAPSKGGYYNTSIRDRYSRRR